MEKTKQSGSTTSKTADKQESNSELLKRTDIKDSPFTIISMVEKNEHFAVMGDYRVTEVYHTLEMAKETVQKVTWNRIVQVIMIMNEKNKTK